MPEAIPSTLVPYLLDNPPDPCLTLVSSTLSTPAHWLLIRYLFAALQGTSTDESRTEPKGHESHQQGAVVLVSLLRPPDLWLELGKKIGLDLAKLAKNKRLVYIDAFSIYEGTASLPIPATSLKSLSLDDLFRSIKHGVQSCTSTPAKQNGHSRRITVIIDGIDFLLASQPHATSVALQQCLSRTMSLCHSLVISSNADSPLLHNREDSSTSLERGHATCITSMAHQASRVLQLRGLDTGAARDVTGVLRISKGGNCDPDGPSSTMAEGEWLYQCKSDGSVRVWLRGE